jgi:hypothetical protein
LEAEGYFIDINGVNSNDLMLSNPKFLPHVIQPKRMIRPFCYFVKDNFNKFGLGKTSGEVSKILSE